MFKYIIRRILQAIPLVFLITVIVFTLLKFSGDPLAYLAQDPTVTEADRFLLRAKLGLNDPMPLQFVHWLIGDNWYWRDITGDGVVDEPGTRYGILRGDLGESFRFRKSVSDVFAEHLPRTVMLAGTAYIVTVVFALVIGVFAALRQYSIADNLITGFSFITFSLPVFLLALILVQVFAVEARKAGLPALPVSGLCDPRGDCSMDEVIRHLILPVLSLSLISIAGYSRYIRATMLEVINTDYVRTARAKGLSENRIVFLHALKNASLPLVTLIGLDIPGILSGAVITETIFSWPGMGYMFTQALDQLDAPLLVSFVLMIAIAVIAFQLLTDIVYAWLDPRIRYS
jgi:peptide/nickel transport system permease protein